MSRQLEKRISSGYTIKADDATGILKAYVSIFGIEDESWMNDVIEPGSFKKTIAQRGPGGSKKIRVLNMHDTREVIGLPLLLEEHSRHALPAFILEAYPNATGGLYAETQLVLGVKRAQEIFDLYKAGAMDEWSIGFDVVQNKFEERGGRQVRIIQELKLWEYSPVTWGANPATTTVEVKNDSRVFAVLADIKRLHPEYGDVELLKEAEAQISPAAEGAEADLMKAVAEIKAEHSAYTVADIVAELAVKFKLNLHTHQQLTNEQAALLALTEKVIAENSAIGYEHILKRIQAEVLPEQVIETGHAALVQNDSAATQAEPPLVNLAEQARQAAQRKFKLIELELKLAMSKGQR